MINILMVCTGNLCRSPIAAGVLRKKLQERNISAVVDSAGFETYNIGEQLSEQTLEFARNYGIDISDHTMRLFTIQDFDNYDRIYAIDHGGYKDVMFLTRNDQDRLKIDYLLNTILPGQNKMVPNPYTGDMANMESSYQLIDKACEKIAESLT